jgi:hypothetical protein
MSSSLYTTFGNQIKYNIVEDTLVSYLENATIKFPLPEASADILGKLTDPQSRNFDPAKYFMVNSKLVKLGFKKPKADALTDILMQVATAQGVDPLDFFSVNVNTLNLTLDAYRAINNLRPTGNRVGLVLPTLNSRSRAASLIRQ